MDMLVCREKSLSSSKKNHNEYMCYFHTEGEEEEEEGEEEIHKFTHFLSSKDQEPNWPVGKLASKELCILSRSLSNPTCSLKFSLSL